jgi:hypothetical protein
VILFDETLRQKAHDGTPFATILKSKGALAMHVMHCQEALCVLLGGHILVVSHSQTAV